MNHLALIGPTSYIARHVLRSLSGDPAWKVSLLGRSEYTDTTTLKATLETIRPTHILNCVGVLHSKSDDEYFLWNEEFPKKLIDCIESLGYKIEKLILLGSAAEYGIPERNPITEDTPARPVSAYGRAKAGQTEAARKAFLKGSPIQIARLFNIIGPQMTEQLSVGNFIQQALTSGTGGVIETGPLSSIRDFLDIRDVAHAIEILLKSRERLFEVNICSGVPTRIKDLLELIVRTAGKSQRVVEKGHADNRNTASAVYGSPEKLRSLGWRQTHSLEDSVRYALTT